MDGGEQFPTTVESLRPCGSCGRTFNSETLLRHEKICQKNSSKQRKVFNSQNQRAVPDVTTNGKPAGTRTSTTKPNPKQSSGAGKSKWREQHEQFVQTIRAARGVTKALKEGKELPPPLPPTINPDYVQCEYCSRRFNEHAAERHIKFCAEQHKRLGTKTKAKTAATLQATTKQERRTGYRPPMPSSGVRRAENFSNTTSNLSGFGASTSKARQPKSATSTVRDRNERRFNNNTSTFDTALPASNIVTTRTGLKARILANNSPSDIDTSEFEGVKSKTNVTHGRRNTRNNSKDLYQGYHQPSVRARVNRTGQASHVTKYDWDLNSEDSFDFMKQNAVRKTSTGRVKRQSALNHGSCSNFDQSTTRPQRGYENSLNDFVAREFGSRFKDTNGHKSNGIDTSPYSDYDGNDNSFKGQGEPMNLLSKNSSFMSDGSRGSSSVNNNNNPISRFCHECGSRFPIETAKFCCECGMKRILL